MIRLFHRTEIYQGHTASSIELDKTFLLRTYEPDA